MITSWRRRRAARRNAKNRNSDEGGGAEELAIPNHFLCPISLQLMQDPVTLTTGATYDRHSIETWLDSGNSTCPVTNRLLTNLDPVPNHAIREMIQDWCVDNRARGVERIPTPRVPMASYEVFEIFSSIEEATQHGDGNRCRELAAKMKESAKESERNKGCFVSNGAGRILSAAFAAFSPDENVAVLEEILSAVVSLTPALEEETCRNLSSPPSLQKIIWFLRFGNLSAMRNAALALKSILSFNQDMVDDVAEIDGALEALMKLIEEPICPTATKASLLSLYYLVKPPDSGDGRRRRKEAIATELAEMGLVRVLVEMAVDSERSTCEKALAVLDGMCSYGEGRENALMIPVVVKKLLRVSDMATEFAVSILWKVVREEDEVAEAVGAGAFHKVLLVLQIGGDERTKEKATELLRTMNGYRSRSRVECVVDSLDFKHVKRPF